MPTRSPNLTIDKGKCCEGCEEVLFDPEHHKCPKCGKATCVNCQRNCHCCGESHCRCCTTEHYDNYYGNHYYFCSNCVVSCSYLGCGTKTGKSLMHKCCCEHPKYYCNNHIRNLSKCAKCGGRVCHDCKRSHGGAYYCVGCYIEYVNPFSAKPRRVLDHGFQPPKWPIFADEKDKSPTYGAEVELTFPQNKQSEVFDIAHQYLEGRHIWKHDSSIPTGEYPYGAELIIAPHTMNELKKVNFKDLFKKFEEVGVRGHEPGSCGIHVHFSNEALIPSKAYSLRWFMVHNMKFLLAFSRRTEIQLQRWSAVRTPNDYAWETEKYSALNYKHKNTYEMRIFRSTTNAEQYMGIMQFVDSLIHFTNAHSLGVLKNPSSLKYYFNYLRSNDRYQALVRYLKRNHTAIFNANA